MFPLELGPFCKRGFDIEPDTRPAKFIICSPLLEFREARGRGRFVAGIQVVALVSRKSHPCDYTNACGIELANDGSAFRTEVLQGQGDFGVQTFQVWNQTGIREQGLQFAGIQFTGEDQLGTGSLNSNVLRGPSATRRTKPEP